MHHHIRISLALLLLAAAPLFGLSPKAPDAGDIADRVQEAHNLESWWGKEVVKAEVQIVFGGESIVDGSFIFEAHGPKARYDRKDGVSIIYDGETAWVTPAGAEAPMGRFHVLTWPWFIMAPFKMQGEGITLSDLGEAKVDGKLYYTILQTFADDMGDTPDDWYRFFIDPQTMRIDMMSYIVTYGKSAEAANEQASIIRYFDYTMPEMGPSISTRYEFWYWDAEAKAFEGDGPKGTGSVPSIEYLEADEAFFAVPEDARELPMPE
jgi:hypothetical protein